MGFEPKAPRVQLGGMENPGLTSSPNFFNCFSAFFCDEFLSQGRLYKDPSLTFVAETTMGCKRKDRVDLWNIFHRSVGLRMVTQLAGWSRDFAQLFLGGILGSSYVRSLLIKNSEKRL